MLSYTGVHWRGPKGSHRRLEVEHHTETDPADPYCGETYKKYILAEFDANGHRSVFREFIMEPSGAILEIFETRNATYTTTSIFNTKDKDVDQTDREEVNSKEDDALLENDHHSDAHSEHTGQHSARRSNRGGRQPANRKVSPRSTGGSGASAEVRSGGAAFPDLLSSLGESFRSNNANNARPRGAETEAENAPLLRSGSFNRGGVPAVRSCDRDMEGVDGEAFF
jgi:hypothetical protein